MWQGDEAVEVRRGPLRLSGGDPGSPTGGIDGPEQFLWRGRLWRVCVVQAHWVETAAWWEPTAAYDAQEAAVAGVGTTRAGSGGAVGVLDQAWGPQRSVYRVEAGCGRHGRREVFDLAFDPDSGRWQLERVTGR